MRITDIKATKVNVPLKAPIRWSWGIRKGRTRTIFQVYTDEGIVGLGETTPADDLRGFIEWVRSRILGEDPFNLERIIARTSPRGLAGDTNMAGVEMALWDIMGKAVDKPVCQLLGGRYREEIPFSAYIFYRYQGPQGEGGESSPEEIVKYCQKVINKYGFKVLKLKAGVFPPKTDIQTIAALRETFGDSMELRIDPNAVWSVQTSIRVCHQLEKYDLEYIEDPTWGIEGMSQVRREISVPFATNMCVVNFDQIPLAIRQKAVDVILADPHHWGGLSGVKKLAAVCQTFKLGLSMHCGAQLGISTAAYLHLIASTPYFKYASDNHYHHFIDDIISEMWQYKDGCIKVPTKPGLGVELDEEKFKKYTELNKREGDYPPIGDEFRPDWMPSLPQW